MGATFSIKVSWELFYLEAQIPMEKNDFFSWRQKAKKMKMQKKCYKLLLSQSSNSTITVSLGWFSSVGNSIEKLILISKIAKTI